MRRVASRILPSILGFLLLAGCSANPDARRDRFLAAGKKLLERHEYVRAGIQFKNAVQAAPRDPEAYYQLALASLGTGDLRGAVVLLKKANELDPKHIATQLKLAELMSGTDDREVLEDAEKRVREVLALAPEKPDALNTLAVTAFKLGRPGDAETYLQDALLTAPAYIATYANLAVLELSRKNLDGAEKILKQATKAAPTAPEAWVGLGRFYIFAHRLPEAEAQFRKAVNVNAHSGEALLDLARIEIATGKTDEAEKTLRTLSELPDEGFKHYHAAFLFGRGRVDEAIAEFAAIAKKYPNSRAARTRLVAAYFQTKKVAEAERILNEALKTNPKDIDALLQRSQIYLRDGKTGEAETDLIQVIRSRPEDAVAHYSLSRVYLVRDADQLRRQELSEALRLDSSLLQARIELVQALLTARAPKVALDLIDGAPEAQRKLLPVLVMRNWALLSAGNLDGARKGIAEGLARSKAPELLLQEGVLKLNQRDSAGGRAALEEVLKKNPDDLRAVQALANSYFAEKKDAAGIASVKAHTAQNPTSAPMQAYLGQILLLAGDRPGARAAFEATKKADPGYQPADVGLAMLDSMEGNLDSARQILRGLAQQKKPNSLAAVRLGMLEESAHNYAAAIAAYKKAAETRTGDWVPFNNLANCLILIGQYDEALRYAQQAKEIAPTSPFVTDTIGWAFYNKGMYEAAVKQLEGLKNDQMALHRYHLTMAYFKNGDIARGKTTLEGALKLDPGNPQAALAQQVAAQATTMQNH